MIDLRGRVALVTGASRGLGAGIAAALARAGATIAINYLANDEAAARVVEQIEGFGGRALRSKCDVRDAEAVAAAVERIEAEVGPLSILVHNAGAAFRPTNFVDTCWDDFQHQFGMNVRGAVNCCRVCLPGMSARRTGAVIFVASSAAHGVPPSQWSSYVTAKAALLGLARSLAVEFAPLGVRINSISPGMSPTDLTAFVPERMKQVIAQQTPLRRLASAEEVGAAVAFLASDAAAYLTGITLPVAGGALMM